MRPANVFRGTSILAGHAFRVYERTASFKRPFELDRVSPPIAKVIGICKTFARQFDKRDQPVTSLILGAVLQLCT